MPSSATVRVRSWPGATSRGALTLDAGNRGDLIIAAACRARRRRGRIFAVGMARDADLDEHAPRVITASVEIAAVNSPVSRAVAGSNGGSRSGASSSASSAIRSLRECSRSPCHITARGWIRSATS